LNLLERFIIKNRKEYEIVNSKGFYAKECIKISKNDILCPSIRYNITMKIKDKTMR